MWIFPSFTSAFPATIGRVITISSYFPPKLALCTPGTMQTVPLNTFKRMKWPILCMLGVKDFGKLRVIFNNLRAGVRILQTFRMSSENSPMHWKNVRLMFVVLGKGSCDIICRISCGASWHTMSTVFCTYILARLPRTWKDISLVEYSRRVV